MVLQNDKEHCTREIGCLEGGVSVQSSLDGLSRIHSRCTLDDNDDVGNGNFHDESIAGPIFSNAVSTSSWSPSSNIRSRIFPRIDANVQELDEDNELYSVVYENESTDSQTTVKRRRTLYENFECDRSLPTSNANSVDFVSQNIRGDTDSTMNDDETNMHSFVQTGVLSSVSLFFLHHCNKDFVYDFNHLI